MVNPRTAYELSESQVTTPASVVSLFWRLTKQYREHVNSVLDLGAGDCRFAEGGSFDRYVGLEIDRKRISAAKCPANGEVIHGCVFRHRGEDYDACIGNPPYARHHYIQSPWKENTIARLERQMGVSLDKHCNLYIYFFCLALLKSSRDGLVSLLIPYEWVSRPSSKALREYILTQGWNVTVYRFQKPIFEGVLTTASISIVDKARRDSHWRYYDITPNYNIVTRHGITGLGGAVLDYADRGDIWALRGLSPGSQKVFTLTEGERIHAGLSILDVMPCVTTLRRVPRNLRVLSQAAFQKHFVQAGERCWLIRSNEDTRSSALNAYLEAVPEQDRQTFTCQHQTPWFKYLPHPVPQMLFSSGFTEFGPKILINSIGASAVGSVYGIHAEKKLPVRRMQNYLLKINFERRVVSHAKTLKKVEVKQLNTVLNEFVKQKHKNVKKRSR